MIPWPLWWQSTRPKTLSASVCSVLLASALSYYHGAFRLGPSLICLAFAMLCQILSNFANDYFDALKGADGPSRKGPQRLVALGIIPLVSMLRAIKVVALLAFLIGTCILMYRPDFSLVILGVFCIVFAIAYTGGPFPLAYLGLGDLFVLLFFGFVSVAGTFYVQAGFMGVDIILAGLAYGLLASNILAITSYRDIETDRLVHKNTLGVRFGHGFVEKQYRCSMCIAFTVPLLLWAFWGYPSSILFSLAIAPLALRFLKVWSLQKKDICPQWSLKHTVLILLGYTALWIVGLIIGKP